MYWSFKLHVLKLMNDQFRCSNKIPSGNHLRNFGGTVSDGRKYFPIFMKYITGGFVGEEEAGSRLFQVLHDPKCTKSGVNLGWVGGVGSWCILGSLILDNFGTFGKVTHQSVQDWKWLAAFWRKNPVKRGKLAPKGACTLHVDSLWFSWLEGRKKGNMHIIFPDPVEFSKIQRPIMNDDWLFPVVLIYILLFCFTNESRIP